LLVHILGQAEVGQLGDAIGAEQHVGRLEVAMDDSFVMCKGDGPRQCLHHLGSLARWQRHTVHLALETAAVEVLQREEGLAFVLTDFVNRDDIRVLQLSDGLGLDQKAGQLCFAGMRARENHLEGDEAVEAQVLRLVDHTHAAAAQYAQDLVAGNMDTFERVFVFLLGPVVPGRGGMIDASGCFDLRRLRRDRRGRLTRWPGFRDVHRLTEHDGRRWAAQAWDDRVDGLVLASLNRF
jgi:hypothetical protein